MVRRRASGYLDCAFRLAPPIAVDDSAERQGDADTARGSLNVAVTAAESASVRRLAWSLQEANADIRGCDRVAAREVEVSTGLGGWSSLATRGT
jgi:hypothetical protein